MKILLNGKETPLEKSISLHDLLVQLNLKPELVACEYNLNIVKRKEYPNTQINDGDRLEIIQMIGGG